MTQIIADALRQATNNFVEAVVHLLPLVLTTIVIVGVGWLVAMALRTMVRWVAGRIRLNAAARRMGLAPVLQTADLPTAERLAGSIVFWVVWIGFLLSGIDVLGLTALRGLVDGFVVFVPRLIVALTIVAAGFVLANLAWRATLLAAVNANLPSARLLSGAVRALVLILAVAMALDHIALARPIVLTAFAIAFGAVMLGLAIAFGVGGGGIARRILEHWFPERTPPDSEDLRHL